MKTSNVRIAAGLVSGFRLAWIGLAVLIVAVAGSGERSRGRPADAAPAVSRVLTGPATAVKRGAGDDDVASRSIPLSIALAPTGTDSSAISPESVEAAPSEAPSLRVYGYVGDGRSHPLSSVASFGGKTTTGWSLAQWKAILPAAEDLSDEADWVAIQTYINAANRPFELKLPVGTAVVNRTIVSCERNVAVHGAGRAGQTTIHFTGRGRDFWRHCRDGQRLPAHAQFEARDLTVLCAVPDGSCGDFLKVTLNNYGAGSLTLQALAVGIIAANSRFANGIDAIGNGATQIDDVNIGLGVAGPISGTCFRSTTAAPFSVLVHIRRSHFFYCGTGIEITNDGVSNGTEGIRIIDVDIDQAIDSIKLGNEKAGYGVPEILIRGLQTSFFRSVLGFHGVAGSGFTDVLLTDGWFIQLPANASSGPIHSTAVIDFTKVKRGTIAGNTYTGARGVSTDYIAGMGSDTEEVTIRDNKFLAISATIRRAEIGISATASSIDEYGNFFNRAATNTFVEDANPSNMTHRSETYINKASGNKCRLVGRVRTGADFDGRQITCSDTIVGKTDAAGNLAVVYPIPFAVPPAQVVLVNGDIEAFPGFCGIRSATITTKGFVARCPAAVSRPVRVNYTVTGS